MPSPNPKTSPSLDSYLNRCSKSERSPRVILSTKSVSSGKSNNKRRSRSNAKASQRSLSTSPKPQRVRHHVPRNNSSISSISSDKSKTNGNHASDRYTNNNMNDDDEFQLVSAESATIFSSFSFYGSNKSMLIGRRWSDKCETEESSHSNTDDDDVFFNDNSFVSTSSSSISSTMSPVQPKRRRSILIVPDNDDQCTSTTTKKKSTTRKFSRQDSFDGRSLYPMVW